MNRKRHSILLLLLFAVLLPSPARAASVGDFAHVHALKTTLEGAVYRVTLPRFVYEGLMQPDQQDLAVFNAAGEVIPFVVREHEPSYRDIELSGGRVPFYELPPESGAADGVEPLDVYVETGAGGRIVSVKSGGDGKARVRRYLLDFSGLAAEDGASRHELYLSLPDETLSAKASAYESANLRDWAPMLRDAPLMRLANEETRLVSDRVGLPRAPEDYVLLRIEGATPSFDLKGVTYSAVIRSDRWGEEIDIEGVTEDGPGFAAQYDTGGLFPVATVNFVLREPGFYRSTFFSRPDAQSAWRAHGGMAFSMIREQDGSVRWNAPMPVGLCEDRYWRVAFEGAFSGPPPRLQITWRPAGVIFLAQGSGPYLLAFGNAQVLPPLQNDGFLRGGVSVMDVAVGEAVSVDAAPDESPAAQQEEENMEWQRCLVWGLLVLSGLLLSAMAWRLMKGKR